MISEVNGWKAFQYPDRPKKGMYIWSPIIGPAPEHHFVYVDKFGLVWGFDSGTPRIMQSTTSGNGGWWHELG